MRACFKIACLATAAASFATAASIPQSSPALVTSVVRVDSRTGRLVRGVVVSPGFLPKRPKMEAESPGASRVGKIVRKLSMQYDLDPLLIHSIIEVESNYNPFAVSDKGALGLMQLVPATARRFGVRNPFDPEENISGGVRYLKYLSQVFPSDLRLVLAAYNAGEAAVTRHNEVPHYPETEQYVYRVGKAYGKRRRAVRKAGWTAPQSSRASTGDTRPVELYVDAEGRLNLRTR